MAVEATRARLRLAFFGTPAFAVPTFERLLDGPHEVVAAICQPDRRRGRGRSTSPAPVAEAALREGAHLIRPEHIGDPAVVEELRERAPDLGVVVAFGQFLPKQVRELPSLGYLINGHASLLPRYRGAAPIVACILNGDSITGTSAMRVEREMDSGAVALQREITIGENESGGQLSRRLADLTADTLEEVISQIAAGRVVWKSQDATRATAAPKIERADRILDWSESADALTRRVRAMAPTPGAFTTLDGEDLQILDARCAPGVVDVEPGTVRLSQGDGFQIATGGGWLVPRVLKRPGKRALPLDEFLRGKAISDGARLV